VRATRLESAGWLLLAAYAVAGLATLTSAHGWGDDWAQYVLHARNIVSGVPYGDTGYVFNPDAPYVGPPEYPPGLPLLLAPAIALFGVDIVALKAVCFLCFIAMLPIAYAVLARFFGKAPAFAAVVLFALHEQVWTLRQFIGSEAPYLLFSVAALWHASRERSGSAAGAGAISGVLVYASVACRSVGLALVPALLLDAWLRRKPVSWYAAFLASFLLLVAAQNSLLVAPPIYAGELVLPGLQLIVTNVRGYWDVARDLVPMPVGFLSHAALAAVIAAAIVGARAARGPPVPVWYLLAYLGVLAVVSISPGPRYLLPIMPIVLALAASGVAHLARRAAHPRRTIAACAAALAVYYAGLFAYARELREDELATCAACGELYAFLREHTPAGSVIAFAKPRALALFAERPGWIWNPDYDEPTFRAKLRERASYLVIAAPGTLLRERYPAYVDARFERDIGTRAFSNAMFTVVELRFQFLHPR
jgi:4-amino-4-deoxy-L-arabinose transferase-like glycosyltransferase